MRWLTALLIVPLLAGCVSSTDPAEEPVADTEAPHPLAESSFTWIPFFPRVGDAVTFEPHVRSTERNDELLGVKWSIEGTVQTDNQPVHSFLSAGIHNVTLTIQTSKAGAYTLSNEVEVLAKQDGDTGVPADEPLDPSEARILITDQNDTVVSFAFQFGEAVDQIHWDFGDGAQSTEERPTHDYGAAGNYTVNLRLLSAVGVTQASTPVSIAGPAAPQGLVPHVVVAVADTGINPYHELYRRPELTAHPCTYIQDFPCDIPALELTLDAPSFQQALAADMAKWKAIKPGDWFWIPGTAFVAVHCQEVFDPDNGDLCILDDSNMHGTGTTSSVIMENPDALLAFQEYNPTVDDFVHKGIPVDVYSFSWGPSMPVVGLVGWTPAFPAGLCPWDVPADILYVKSSGNEPGLTVLADCWSGHPDAISVGGGYAEDDTQEPLAYKDMDVVSYFCRPTAQTQSLSAMRASYCGTSFSAPTVAGSLSKVVLGLRRQSGYLGSVEAGVVDPVLGITVRDVRDAMEITASYDPEPEYDSTGLVVPVNPVAPWTQWGWGFYDGTVAEATLKHLLGDTQPDKSAEARLYLETQYQLRETLYG